jgi:hypothetical protein
MAFNRGQCTLSGDLELRANLKHASPETIITGSSLGAAFGAAGGADGPTVLAALGGSARGGAGSSSGTGGGPAVQPNQRMPPNSPLRDQATQPGPGEQTNVPPRPLRQAWTARPSHDSPPEDGRQMADVGREPGVETVLCDGAACNHIS